MQKTGVIGWGTLRWQNNTTKTGNQRDLTFSGNSIADLHMQPQFCLSYTDWWAVMCCHPDFRRTAAFLNGLQSLPHLPSKNTLNFLQKKMWSSRCYTAIANSYCYFWIIWIISQWKIIVAFSRQQFFSEYKFVTCKMSVKFLKNHNFGITLQFIALNF